MRSSAPTTRDGNIESALGVALGGFGESLGSPLSFLHPVTDRIAILLTSVG